MSLAVFYIIRQFCIRQSYKEYHTPTAPTTFICHKYSKIIAHASSPRPYSRFAWPYTVPSMIPTFSTTLSLFPTVIISRIRRNRGRDRGIMSAISAVTWPFFFRFKILFFPNCFCFKIFLILYYSVINKEKVI